MAVIDTPGLLALQLHSRAASNIYTPPSSPSPLLLFPFPFFSHLSENRRTDDARRRSARTVSSKSAADLAPLDAARCRRRAELEPERLLSHTDNFR